MLIKVAIRLVSTFKRGRSQNSYFCLSRISKFAYMSMSTKSLHDKVKFFGFKISISIKESHWNCISEIFFYFMLKNDAIVKIDMLSGFVFFLLL